MGVQMRLIPAATRRSVRLMTFAPLRRLRGLLLLLALAVCGTPALADSWAPPSKQTYMSPSGSARLTVTPRGLSGALPFFEDKVGGREPAGQAPGEAVQPRGLVEVKGRDGRWTRLWEGPLVNDVAPVSALVSDDGRRAVTFDNWHMTGWGDDVVVVYDETGRSLAAHGLDDVLPPEYVGALPRSVSSIRWSGAHRLSEDGARLILQVVVPSAADERRYVELEIDLVDGRPVPPSGAAWEEAKAAASAHEAALRTAHAQWEAAFRAPLSPPETGGEREWHGYLLEAFFRLDPDWEEGFPAVKLLRHTGHPDYRQSERWVAQALTVGIHVPRDALVFGSPDEANLVEVLGKALRKLKPGRLQGLRIYVAVGEARRAAVAGAVAHLGAEFVQIDPAVPIPQNKARLRKREEALAREDR